MDWEHAVLMLWGLAVAILDARTRRLPNTLTLGAALLAGIYLAGFGRGPLGTSPVSNLLAAGIFLVVLVPAYARHWVGGGDVKLGLALGLLGGTKVTLLTLAGGGLLLAALGWRALRRRTGHGTARTVPYGTAHGIGFAVAINLAGNLPGGIY